jgi:hypothetical protein
MLNTLFALLTFAVVLMPSPQAHAAISPLSVSVVPPVQFPPADFTITGARLSLIYGKQRDIYGLDLGVIGNVTELTFTGAAVSGLFNITHGTTTVIGLQAAGGANINTNKTRVIGLQIAAGLNLNEAESSIAGLQLALANLSPHTRVYGAQVGVYNKAQDVYGLQIGVVNVANSLHGIQIGLLNYNVTGTLAVSPILNAGF